MSQNLLRKGYAERPIFARGPGRRRGQPNIIGRLAKDGLAEVFEELGGVEGMVERAMSSPKNLYAFYIYVWPKLLGAQVVEAAAERLADRPMISRIECVIVDPKDDYRTTVIDDGPYRGEES